MSGAVQLMELRDLSVSYDGNPVLRTARAQVSSGECILLTGDNGSGKSTLLRVLAGLQKPTSGRRIAGIAPRDIRLMPQSPRLAWSLSAAMNVAVALADRLDLAWTRIFLHPRTTRMRYEALRTDAMSFLVRFGLETRAAMPARELSGGERKLLAVAVALAGRAPLVLLDEPFAGLSDIAAGNVRAAIRDAKAEGRTIIIVEHRTNHAAVLADRVWYLSDGELRETAVADHAAAGGERRSRTGGSVEPVEAVVMNAASLRGGWGNAVIVDDATFALSRGSITGIIGENGSGKSTLVALLSGIVIPSGGTLLLAGRDVTDAPPHERVHLGMRVLLQTRRIFSKLSINENIRLGGRKDGGQHMLPLRVDGHRLGGTLSGGEQTILGLQVATSEERVIVVVLDEPTAGLDPSARARIGERLMSLQSDGTACLVVEHDRAFMEQYSDSILVLRDGRVADEVIP